MHPPSPKIRRAGINSEISINAFRTFKSNSELMNQAHLHKRIFTFLYQHITTLFHYLAKATMSPNTDAQHRFPIHRIFYHSFIERSTIMRPSLWLSIYDKN